MLHSTVRNSIASPLISYSLIINWVGLYILAGTFLTLDLIFLSITNMFVGTAWLILLILKIKYRSK